METVRLRRICTEDLDLGSGTRDVRLFDESLATLTQVSLATLLQVRTQRLVATNAAAVLTASSLFPAGARRAGMTVKVLTGLGTSAGLTGVDIGDSVVSDRWGTLATLTVNAETSQADFHSADWPVSSAASDGLLQAVGGTFDGTGLLEVSGYYFVLTHRSV